MYFAAGPTERDLPMRAVEPGESEGAGERVILRFGDSAGSGRHDGPSVLDASLGVWAR